MARMGPLPVLGDVTCRQVSAPLSLDLGDSWYKPGPREASASLEVPLGAVGYSASSPVAHRGLLSAVWGSGVIVASTTFTCYLAHPQNESGVYTLRLGKRRELPLCPCGQDRPLSPWAWGTCLEEPRTFLEVFFKSQRCSWGFCVLCVVCTLNCP